MDRNVPYRGRPGRRRWSPSSRRAWVEITNKSFGGIYIDQVALLVEGVGRNYCYDQSVAAAVVALLTEGVDRNYDVEFEPYNTGKVALLAKGVGRNS